MRKSSMLLAAALLAFVTVAAQAQPDRYFAGGSSFTATNDLLINSADHFNFDSGWFRNDGIHFGGNTNYIAGYCFSCAGFFYHDYFSFDLSQVTGVTTASFTVYTFDISQDAGIYLLYGTSLSPSDVASLEDWADVGKYDALVAGPLLGSIAVSPGDSFTNVTVALDADGIAWLNANAGKQIVLGGDWIQVAGPEPGTLILIGTGIAGLAGAVRRKLL